MKYNVETGPSFDREFKRLVKKYASLKQEIANLSAELSEKPETGTALGQSCFKLRLAIKSKGKGKRGGARIITCVFTIEAQVVLLSIYDKAERDSISDLELKQLINEVTF